MDAKLIQMLDICIPDNVEIVFNHDSTKLWINVDGICRLRIQGLAVVDAYRDVVKTVADREAPL